MKTMRLATRGSPLALWQAEAVKAALLSAWPDLRVEVLLVKTRGDRNTRTDLSRLGGTGLFTKEVDREVLEGRADAAVHSLKDHETILPEALVLGAVLPRGPVEDALVAESGVTLEGLPEGARVATGSLRRRAQLLRLRPDLEVVGIRGNVGSRLAQLAAGHACALIMARAGLVRLGEERRVAQVLSTDQMLPAPSQGVVGVTARREDDRTRGFPEGIDHPATRAAALAERALLRALRGGCNVPVGALATLDGERLSLRSRVLSVDGRECIEEQEAAPAGEAEDVGVRVARRLLERGAARLIAEIRG